MFLSHFSYRSATGKEISGKIVYTFGSSALIKTINWSNSKRQAVKIDRYEDNANNINHNNFDSDNYLHSEQEYMYDTMLQKSSIAADRLFDIGEDICKKLILDFPNSTENLFDSLTHVDLSSQEKVKCIGRICSDSDYKLDRNSTILIGADEMKLRTVRLNFDQMNSSISLFPGQIVFAQGMNPRGDIMFVDAIHAKRMLTNAEMPKIDENLSIVMASGPYTSNNDLSYEPLNELLAYCKINKPDVLIMIGPFLDANHPLIVDCTMKTTFETFFDSLISRIADAIGYEF